MLDHFFSLHFPEDSESLKIFYIRLWEVGAKRTLNGTSKLNRHTNRQTDRQTDISTYRKHRPTGPMLWKEICIFEERLSSIKEEKSMFRATSAAIVVLSSANSAQRGGVGENLQCKKGVVWLSDRRSWVKMRLPPVFTPTRLSNVFWNILKNPNVEKSGKNHFKVFFSTLSRFLVFKIFHKTLYHFVAMT